MRTIDDLWSHYPALVAEFRSGLPWLGWASWAQWFPELEAAIPAETARRLAEAEAGGGSGPGERGAVWTYLTTEEDFGSCTTRVLRGLRRKLKT